LPEKLAWCDSAQICTSPESTATHRVNRQSSSVTGRSKCGTEPLVWRSRPSHFSHVFTSARHRAKWSIQPRHTRCRTRR
jgi:hypothetical protein